MTWTEYLLRRPLVEPTSVAPWADARQRIGLIELRLEPPTEIRRCGDLSYIILNHNFLRLILALVWLIVCGYIESFLAQLSEMRYSNTIYDRYPLADLLHDAFPRIQDYQIVNYLLISLLLYTILIFLFLSPDWTTRFIALRRWFIIMGIIYVFRGICLVVTTLPSPMFDNCQPPETALTGSAGARFLFLLQQIGGSLHPCTDNIFSGHTSAMMSCVLIWRVHSIAWRPFAWMAYLLFIAAALMILFTRFHYTVDVILAIYIVYTTWYIYLENVQRAVTQYMFGHSNYRELFEARIDTADAILVYEYLTWQTHPLGKNWLLWFCTYADGLDIRLRALGILDKHGERTREHFVDVHEMTVATGPSAFYPERQSLPI